MFCLCHIFQLGWFNHHLYDRKYRNQPSHNIIQGTMGCTPNSVPMVFIGVFYGFLGIMTHEYPLYRAYIGISNRGTLGSGYIQLSPESCGAPTRSTWIMWEAHYRKDSKGTVPKLTVGYVDENSRRFTVFFRWGDLSDEKLPSYIGIIIYQCKDPY